MVKKCIISKISITPEVHGHNSVDAIQTTGRKVQIHNPNLYVLAITLSINVNIKQGFKGPYNKYVGGGAEGFLAYINEL